MSCAIYMNHLSNYFVLYKPGTIFPEKFPSKVSLKISSPILDSSLNC